MNTENQVLKTKNSTAILKVDPRNLIEKDGFNVRIDMGDLLALSESIVAVGPCTVIDPETPVLVTPNAVADPVTFHPAAENWVPSAAARSVPLMFGYVIVIAYLVAF